MAINTSRNNNVRSGNNIVIKIGGVEVGMAQDMSASDDYGLDAASGIGDIHVREHVPTIARHQIRLSVVALKAGSMRDVGAFTENGDAALEGIVFDIVQQDKATGTELRKYIGCSFASGETTIQKHAIVISNATFMALDVVGVGL